jgi:hypothetical protein
MIYLQSIPRISNPKHNAAVTAPIPLTDRNISSLPIHVFSRIIVDAEVEFIVSL